MLHHVAEIAERKDLSEIHQFVCPAGPTVAPWIEWNKNETAIANLGLAKQNGEAQHRGLSQLEAWPVESEQLTRRQKRKLDSSACAGHGRVEHLPLMSR